MVHTSTNNKLLTCSICNKKFMQQPRSPPFSTLSGPRPAAPSSAYSPRSAPIQPTVEQLRPINSGIQILQTHCHAPPRTLSRVVCFHYSCHTEQPHLAPVNRQHQQSIAIAKTRIKCPVSLARRGSVYGGNGPAKYFYNFRYNI